MSTNALQQQNLEVKIAINASLSGAFDIRSYAGMGILMPSGWDAAAITFLACATKDGTFRSVYTDAGDEVSVSAAASRAISIDLNSSALAPYAWLKIRSGTAALAVVQTAERVLTIALKTGV